MFEVPCDIFLEDGVEAVLGLLDGVRVGGLGRLVVRVVLVLLLLVTTVGLRVFL